MEHTIENCLEAKKKLIELGYYTENDFVEADSMDVEVGYILSEPLLKTNDDSMKSAFEFYSDVLFWAENEDDYIDFCIESGII